MQHFDVAVIGAGFGGIGCALSLAERGAKVALFEQLTYPGGCASTFTRKGYRFESGATLFSGFGQGQLFQQWVEKYELDVDFELMDPVVELRTPNFSLKIPPERAAFIDRFCALPEAPVSRIRDFFEWQESIANVLWSLFDDPELLPPLNATSLLRHMGRSPQYVRLLPLLGKTLEEILRRHEVWDYEPLRVYMDAVCQITVQVSASEAEASFALAAMDYFFRGTGHIHGGIGQLAEGLVSVIPRLGGMVSMADGVLGLTREDGKWKVRSRRQTILVDTVVANILPQNLGHILDNSAPRDIVSDLSESVEEGWGAAMLYLGLDKDKLKDPDAFHIELVDREDEPFIEGNHLFCSVSGDSEEGRAPEGQRVATLSAHLRIDECWQEDRSKRERYVNGVQERMRETLRKLAPEVADAVVFEMTASPRTFARFTNRHLGYVGGIPRRVGLHNYRRTTPLEVAKSLYLVGDTIFPGQSILAVALGGTRIADGILR